MNLWLRIFLPFAAGYFLSYLLRNVNAVIAPELTRELGVSAADLGLLTSAYLLAFGAVQLPLGVLLDRYGPRRVEVGLLLVAALGCLWFAYGNNLGELAMARAAIGLGVSACLMASFKAFSIWFPAERLPSLNAAVMVAGGLGGLAATTPLAVAVPFVGWRGLFLVLAGLTALASAVLFFTPDKATAASSESLGQQLRAMIGVTRSRVFWSYAPQAALTVGGFMALQGLWAIPWLMQIGGLSRDAAAFHLLLTTGGMMTGFLCIALFITRVIRRGFTPDQVLAAGTGVGVLCMLGILLNLPISHALWFTMGLVFSVGNLAYAQLASHFDRALAGRVNSALNLAAFVGAFSVQWSYGALLDALTGRGWTLQQAHHTAFTTLLVLQALSFAWFLLGQRRTARGQAAAG